METTINALYQDLGQDAGLQTEVPTILELNDLQLAYVGGGSGDVGL